MSERQAEKVRENRLRRMAARQALELRKIRRRDPYAIDFDTYFLVRQSESGEEAWSGPLRGLDAVEEWLTSDPATRSGSEGGTRHG